MISDRVIPLGHLVVLRIHDSCHLPLQTLSTTLDVELDGLIHTPPLRR